MAPAGFYAIPPQRLKFGKDGSWYANGELVSHERLAAFFTRYLRRKPDGSGYEVWVDERFHADVEVEDTPYVVTEVEVDASGQWRVRLNDGSWEPLQVRSLSCADDGALYCAVRGDERARFLRAPQARLLEHVEEENGIFYLVAGGQRVPLPAF